MESLHLKEPPFPQGETEEEIRRDPKLCYACYNLDPGSAHTAVEIRRLWMHQTSGPGNARRAAQLGDTGRPPAWASKGRADFASWELETFLTDIAESAASGCVTCMLLKGATTMLCNERAKFDDKRLYLDIVFCKGNAMVINLFRVSELDDVDDEYLSPWGALEHEEEYDTFQLYTLPGSPCPWPTIGCGMTFERPDWSVGADRGGLAGNIASDPNSESTWAMIKNRIDVCMEKHDICSKATAKIERRLPKRVIKVGPATNREIRLLEHDVPIDEPYIALSHCWGGSVPLMLKKDSLDRYKENIPHHLLPRTFQDAVEITRKLGIEHVWIDSLCIVQDDHEDWEIEASKMASIYDGATLVVAATGSVNSAGGCLSERRPYVAIGGTFPDGKPFEIYGRTPLVHDVFGWNTEATQAKGSSNPIVGTKLTDRLDHPLMKRAWCFQERLLATRVLHFTKNEIVFECLTCMDCECGALSDHERDPLLQPRRILKMGPEYLDDTASIKNQFARPKPSTDDGSSPPSLTQSRDFLLYHEVWRDLVVQYSQKDITRRSDGLPAIAGLASKWTNNLTGDYLAGLWAKDLLNGLRWYSDEQDTSDETPYIAPSWSWLSVRRGVTWGINQLETTEYFVYIDFSRTRCHPSGVNSFGELTCGYIYLTGDLLPVSYSIIADQVWLSRDGYPKTIPFNYPDHLDRLGREGEQTLFCLRFCTKMVTSNAYDDDCAFVLVKADPEVLKVQPREVREHSCVYERVGFIQNYPPRYWEHEKNSKREEMYMI